MSRSETATKASIDLIPILTLASILSMFRQIDSHTFPDGRVCVRVFWT